MPYFLADQLLLKLQGAAQIVPDVCVHHRPHLLQRESEKFQHRELLELNDIVLTVQAGIALEVGRLQQSDPVIIPQRPDGHSCSLGNLSGSQPFVHISQHLAFPAEWDLSTQVYRVTQRHLQALF
ncbi:hypothetical protein D3C75_639230 [compost metagenome]